MRTLCRGRRKGSRHVHSGFSGGGVARLGDDESVVRWTVFPSGVTAIGSGALMAFAALESVVFPASCIAVGTCAFSGCEALKAVSTPVGCKATGMEAFLDCSSLVCVTIPEGFMELGQ
jgi:hypothetical protein